MTPRQCPDSPRGTFSESGAGHDPGATIKLRYKFLDTGFSFEVEDREILFYRVKPLLPKGVDPGRIDTIEGPSFKDPKRDNSGRRGKQNG